VAAGISSAVVLSAYAALTGGLAVYERAGAVSVEAQVVRGLTSRLTRELQAACFRAEATDLPFVGEEPDELAGERGSRLTFVTASSSNGSGGPGPLSEVEYYLVEPDPAEDEPGGLYRRATPLLDRQVADVVYEGIDSGQEEDARLLAPEVVGFELAYYDPEAVATTGGLGLRASLTGEEEWETSWDAASKGYLPGAVRVTFYLGDWPESEATTNRESEGKGTRRVVLVVPLPLAQGSSAEGNASAQAGGTRP